MKLTTRLTVSLILLSTMPLIIVSALTFRSTSQALEAQELDELSIIISLKSLEVERWLTSAETTVATLAENPQMRDYASMLLTGGLDDTAPAGAQSTTAGDQLNWFQQQGGVDTLFLLDATDGTVMASTERWLLNRSFVEEPLFELGQQEPSTLSPIYPETGAAVTIPVSAPIVDEDGNTLAVLVGYVDAVELAQIVDEQVGNDRTQHTYLVDRRGRLVTHPAIHQNTAAPGDVVSSEGIDACVSGKPGSNKYVDYNDIPVIGMYWWSEAYGLCLITEIDQAEALTSSTSLLWTILIITAGIGLLVGVFSLGFAQSLDRPISRLVEGAHRLGSGDLSHRVDVERHDELGILAASFNDMAADLSSSQAALREARDELEQRVEARTNELQQANVRLLAEIDERQEAELALQQLNRAYRTLSYGSLAVAHAEEERQLFKEVCRVAVETGGYTLAWVGQIVEGDPGTVRILVRYGAEASYLDDFVLSLSEDTPTGQGPVAEAVRTGEPVIVEDAQTDPRMKPWRERAIERGYVSIVVLPLKRESQVCGVLTLYTRGGEHIDGREVGLLNDLANNLAHGIAALRNRAERARIEEALARSEERFRSLVQNASDVITVLDADGTILYQSPAERLHGFEQDEILGKNIFSHVHPEDEGILREETARVLADPSARLSAAIRLKHHDGNWHVIELVGRNQLDNPAVGGIVLNGRNITERVRSEQALREKEQRFRKMFDEGPLGMGIINLDFSFERVNSRLCEITGYTPEELLSKTFVDITHPDDVDVDVDLAAALSRGQIPSYSLEKRYICKDGTPLWVNLTVSIIRDDECNAMYYIAMIEDIQERKETEKMLAQYMDELKRSNDDLQQFAYVASHDLQEPLRMVTSYLQLIERRYKGQLDQDADDFIYYAVDGANRMKALIQDLLSFSRVGTRGNPFGPVDSEAVLGGVLDTLKLSIQETGAVVTHDPLPAVQGDTQQLVQVFQNLLSNSLKFTGDARPEVHVSAERVEDMWQFSVQDNGIGFEADEYGERIFVIFQRLNSRAAYEGTGIGLAICKKIIERHGGRIWCESKPGKGAMFSFTLPACEDNEHG